MKSSVKWLIAVIVIGSLSLGGTLWWRTYMERGWGPEHRPSDAMLKNRMHVAMLLLQRRGHTVTVAGTLGETGIGALPDGTLIMGNRFGTLAPAKAEQLLAWVRRGNTLVVQPRYLNGAESAQLKESARQDDSADDEEDDEDDDVVTVPADQVPSADAAPAASASASASASADAEEEEEDEDDDVQSATVTTLIESDPIAVRYGVRQTYLANNPVCAAKLKEQRARNKGRNSCPTPIPECQDQTNPVLVPGADHTLELDSERNGLAVLQGAPAPSWSDEGHNAVRVYDEGKGRVVMVANNYFSNDNLQHKDHAEFLLAVAALNRSAGHVTLVKYLDVQPWYVLMWDRFHMLMLSCVALLALSMWAAVRRFGPLMPAPSAERRSLMEHIEASGAWLWKARDGRAVLLEAARAETLALIRRRAPAMARLPETELVAALAEQCQLSPALVSQALYDEAATVPQQFTRQIRTLQTLRNHHER